MNSDSGNKTSKPMCVDTSQPDDGFTSVYGNSTTVNSSKSSESSRRYVSVEKVKLHQILRKLMDESKVSAKKLSAELKIPTATLSTYRVPPVSLRDGMVSTARLCGYNGEKSIQRLAKVC